jgi:hypothetical protein
MTGQVTQRFEHSLIRGVLDNLWELAKNFQGLGNPSDVFGEEKIGLATFATGGLHCHHGEHVDAFVHLWLCLTTNDARDAPLRAKFLHGD